MNELHLFAGAGGGILGGMLLGHTPICAVELEEFPRKVLLQRQRDGILPWFPIWDDVCTFDGKPWKGKVDVVCGGFPCQDISAAGKGVGITGNKSGLWKEYARIISEVRPRFVFVENSPMLTLRGLGTVLGDLAAMGYDSTWGIFSAASFGAEHIRERIFILANTNSSQLKRGELSVRKKQKYSIISNSRWGKDKPGVDRISNGVPYQMDRLKAIGNAQVPIVAATSWRILNGKIEEQTLL